MGLGSSWLAAGWARVLLFDWLRNPPMAPWYNFSSAHNEYTLCVVAEKMGSVPKPETPIRFDSSFGNDEGLAKNRSCVAMPFRSILQTDLREAIVVPNTFSLEAKVVSTSESLSSCRSLLSRTNCREFVREHSRANSISWVFDVGCDRICQRH